MNTDSLLFLVKRQLHKVVAELASQGKSIAVLRLFLEQGTDHEDLVLEMRPASPTRDIVLLLELLRLRLETVRLDEPPCGARVELSTDRHETKQMRLFATTSPRSLAQVRKELAKVAAQLPKGALVTASLRPAHLPEHRAEWRPLEKVGVPRPSPRVRPTQVRRLFETPIKLSQGPDGRLIGPFVVTGGWWAGRMLHKKYYYMQRGDGTILWFAYDQDSDRFFLLGDVE